MADFRLGKLDESHNLHKIALYPDYQNDIQGISFSGFPLVADYRILIIIP